MDAAGGEAEQNVAGGDVGRLYVLESTPSLTGAKASDLLPASTSEIVSFALALAQEMGIGGPLGIELPLAQRAKLLAVAEVEIALRDAETGQRGYLLTGEEAYLEPYRQAVRSQSIATNLPPR